MLEWLYHEDEGIVIFETSVTIYQSAGCHVSEDLNFQQHGQKIHLTTKFSMWKKCCLWPFEGH
jgi:L-amino acid N-acyltransferase YncA